MKNKRGEGYIDICVGVVVFVMLLVTAINLFSFLTLRVEMDRIADELIETATYTGCFDDEFFDRDEEMSGDYYNYTLDYGADEYFNAAYKRVQLGHTMWVTVSKETEVQGLGVIRIPVTVSVTRSGLSQKYWK